MFARLVCGIGIYPSMISGTTEVVGCAIVYLARGQMHIATTCRVGNASLCISETIVCKWPRHMCVYISVIISGLFVNSLVVNTVCSVSEI